MIGRFVMTENELLKRRPTPESVGMGSYAMDSHNVQRYITPEGTVQNEGDIGVSTRGPYQISYGSLVPKKDKCENLLVPVCVSSSHIAYGSIRMEPVFMVLGQSAATAAVMSLEAGIAVQDLPYEKLRERLLADGQVLKLDIPATSDAKSIQLDGIVIDDEDAELTGSWQPSSVNGPFVGHGYCHDGNSAKGARSARFLAKLTPGRYEVRIAYPPNSNRATNVPVTVRHVDGETTVHINQRKKPPQGAARVGVFEFGDSAEIVISNENTDGHVILDAVQLLPAKRDP
jgi:hypothetical protein